MQKDALGHCNIHRCFKQYPVTDNVPLHYWCRTENNEDWRGCTEVTELQWVPKMYAVTLQYTYSSTKGLYSREPSHATRRIGRYLDAFLRFIKAI